MRGSIVGSSPRHALRDDNSFHCIQAKRVTWDPKCDRPSLSLAVLDLVLLNHSKSACAFEPQTRLRQAKFLKEWLQGGRV